MIESKLYMNDIGHGILQNASCTLNLISTFLF